MKPKRGVRHLGRRLLQGVELSLQLFGQGHVAPVFKDHEATVLQSILLQELGQREAIVVFQVELRVDREPVVVAGDRDSHIAPPNHSTQGQLLAPGPLDTHLFGGKFPQCFEHFQAVANIV